MMDQERYERDAGYRRMIDGARKGGRSRSKKKVETARRNVARSKGRPRKDGLAPNWEQRGLSPIEAEKEHRRGLREREARRQRALMADLGWPLEREHQWEDEHMEAGTLEQAEAETGAYMEKVGGSATRSFYELWAEGDQKNLHADSLETVPDFVLRHLCRFRLLGAETETETETAGELDGFAI